MSGLIDMWTNEVSKVKEDKGGEAMFPPHGSTHMEKADSAQQQQKKQMGSVALAVAVGKFNHLNKQPRLLFSEDSVSLLVSCFSP